MLNRVGAGVIITVLAVGCADQGFRLQPPLTPTPLPAQEPIPVPPPPAALPAEPVVLRSIRVGEKVTGQFTPRETWVIDLTVGTSGVAVVRLTWQAALTWVDLTWDGVLFRGPQLLEEVEIVARRPVEAGRPSRLTITDAYPWDNYGSSFVLETSLE